MQALHRPVRVRGTGTFDGIVREIDLDARRFEIRSVTGIGAIRCIYEPKWDRFTRTVLDSKVRVSGSYETSPNMVPRLIAVEAIESIGPPPGQRELDLVKKPKK
jgi:hypothetical protein